MDLHSGWFTVTTPVVGQMCHIKEVGYWFCFPVKHLVAVKDGSCVPLETFIFCFVSSYNLTKHLCNTDIETQHVTPFLPCSVVEGDGRRARRCIQSLLRSTVQDVNILKQKETTYSNRGEGNSIGSYSFVMPLLCLSIKIGAAPSEATVSTRKRQLCLWETGHSL